MGNRLTRTTSKLINHLQPVLIGKPFLSPPSLQPSSIDRRTTTALLVATVVVLFSYESFSNRCPFLTRKSA
jgi:hypothetical protein